MTDNHDEVMTPLLSLFAQLPASRKLSVRPGKVHYQYAPQYAKAALSCQDSLAVACQQTVRQMWQS